MSSIPDSWNDLLLTLPGAHFLQTSEWASIKEQVGWKAIHKAWYDEQGNVIALAQILKRSLTLFGVKLPFSVLYLPKGPLFNWKDKQQSIQIIQDLVHIAREEKALFIKIDPDVWISTGTPETEDESIQMEGVEIQQLLGQYGWQYSNDQIQFKNTVLIDLTQPLPALLASMKQKTRYNIGLAERKGVVVRQGNQHDFEDLYRMYAETSLRDGFVIRSREYYLDVWNTFYQSGYLIPLVASVEGEDVAGLMLFTFGEKAWYVYGMSRNKHRNLMPTYLLQWEAIKAARQSRCTVYDLWGAPNVFDESDTMWGVYKFKQGLGGITMRGIGAWDFPVRPLLYKFYLELLPKFLNILRKKGIQQTQMQIGS